MGVGARVADPPPLIPLPQVTVAVAAAAAVVSAVGEGLLAAGTVAAVGAHGRRGS